MRKKRRAEGIDFESQKREGLGPKAEGVVCVITLGEKIMLTSTPVTT